MKADEAGGRYPLAVGCVFAVGVAIRLVLLYWTPYPFNPDGFMFAAGARDAMASGSVPAPDAIGSQQYGFVVLLATLARITGLEPLWIAQPTVAVIGTVPALFAVLLGRELGAELGWPPAAPSSRRRLPGSFSRPRGSTFAGARRSATRSSGCCSSR